MMIVRARGSRGSGRKSLLGQLKEASKPKNSRQNSLDFDLTIKKIKNTPCLHANDTLLPWVRPRPPSPADHKAKAKKAMASMHISRDPEPEELELHELVTTQLTDTLAWVISCDNGASSADGDGDACAPAEGGSSDEYDGGVDDGVAQASDSDSAPVPAAGPIAWVVGGADWAAGSTPTGAEGAEVAGSASRGPPGRPDLWPLKKSR